LSIPPNISAREALTDNMIERLAMLGGNAMELLDRLNDPAMTPHAVRNALTKAAPAACPSCSNPAAAGQNETRAPRAPVLLLQ
jgi:hypothetical protein